MVTGSETKFREFIESNTPRDGGGVVDSGSTGGQPRVIEQPSLDRYQSSSSSSVFDRNPFQEFTTSKMNELISTVSISHPHLLL